MKNAANRIIAARNFSSLSLPSAHYPRALAWMVKVENSLLVSNFPNR